MTKSGAIFLGSIVLQVCFRIVKKSEFEMLLFLYSFRAFIIFNTINVKTDNSINGIIQVLKTFSKPWFFFWN